MEEIQAMATAHKVQQPYKNMRARKSVLISGFVLSFVSLVLVLMGCLFLFVPSVNFPKGSSPSIILVGLLSAGIAIGFISTVLAVAGANTAKGIARLSMFISSMMFIIGAALLVIILLFRTILPIDAIQRLTASLMM